MECGNKMARQAEQDESLPLGTDLQATCIFSICLQLLARASVMLNNILGGSKFFILLKNFDVFVCTLTYARGAEKHVARLIS